MAASKALDRLRAQFPDCDLIAFADLSANMVLVTSADDDVPQERWDGLCEMAHDVLRSSSTAQALACLDGAPDTVLSRAALFSAAECDIFLTSSLAPDFALCAVGQAKLAVSQFCAAAKPVFDQLAQDE